MKTKISISIGLLMFIVALSIFYVGCEKNDDNPFIAPINFNSKINYGSMIDQDGNVFKTVIIGNQMWMAENLRTTKYRNGDPIENITDSAKWRVSTTGAYCVYDNDTRYTNVLGLLYNGYTIIDNRNICPTNWHIPSDDEWWSMASYLYGIHGTFGGSLKEAGTLHWMSPNEGSTNSSGFTALPGGDYLEGKFYSLRWSGEWWTASECTYGPYVGQMACHRLSSTSDNLEAFLESKNRGLSVRCVRD